MWNILNKSDLKCYRKVKCQILTPALKESRLLKANALLERFENEDWKSVWFSDEASFSLTPQLNRQNERLYRAVTVKTEIKEEDLLVEKDNQMPTLLCYGAVSWYGKTKLYFVEGDAYGQEELPRYKRKKKTVNQEVYTTEVSIHVS